MEIVSDIDADHSNMTKFTGADDPGFVSLCNTLYRWIEELKDAQVSGEYSERRLKAITSAVFVHSY